jgi:hypothetical protein
MGIERSVSENRQGYGQVFSTHSPGLLIVRRLAGSDEFPDGSNKPFWLRGAGYLEFAARSLRCHK